MELETLSDSKGQMWCRVRDDLAWGLDDYYIIRTESGVRLILCHTDERPVGRDELLAWETR